MLTQALRQGGIVHVHVSLLDQRQQLLDGTFRLGQFRLEPAYALAALMLGILALVQESREKIAQPIRLKHAISQLIEHRLVQSLHRDRASFALGRPFSARPAQA